MNATEPEQKSGSTGVEALAELTARLQAWLKGRIRDFHLEAGGGGVVLRGRAQTYYAKQLAQHAVMAVPGLRILANEIEVC